MRKFVRQDDVPQVPFWTSQRLLVTVVVFIGLAVHSMQRTNLSIAIVCMVRPETRPHTWGDNSSRPETRPHMWDDNSSRPETRPHTWGDNISRKDNFSVTHGNNNNVYLNGVDTDSHNSIQGHRNSAVLKENNSFNNATNSPQAGSRSLYSGYHCADVTSAEADFERGEFTWNKETQGLLLGALFWGYISLQILGGVLSERYGARRVIMACMLPVSILDLLSPLCARTSPWLFMANRVLMGVGQGTMYSSVHALFSKWVPKSERGRLVTVSYGGCDIGSALMLSLGGLLCSAFGWPSVFYFTGASGVAWCLLWWGFIWDSPSKCSWISTVERDYLAQNVHVVEHEKSGKPVKVPWRSVFTSVPFISLLVVHAMSAYCFFMMATQMPTYMKEVLKFDLKSNGFFSMLPYITISVMAFVCGYIADQLIHRKILSCQWTRKLMTSIGVFVPAACLVLLTFIECTQQMLAVAVLCITFAFSAFQLAGYLVNHGDIAPQFAGTLFGITNTVGSCLGIVAPYIVAVVTVNRTREEWQIAFIIAAIIYVIGGIQYLIFAKGSVQKWAMSSALQVELNVPDPKDHESDSVLLKSAISENGVEFLIKS